MTNTNRDSGEIATPEGASRAEHGHRWFAALYDRMSASEERGFMGRMRRALLSDLRGDVLEIGAGTGANFPHYPATVRVTATEPDPYMRRRAQSKLAALGRAEIALLEAPAERLTAADASADVVVSTLVLCTVADAPRALAEIARVLRPGGQLRFIEHVRGAGVGARARDMITPVWKRVGAGCHPNRRTEEAMRAAGFVVTITGRRTMAGFLPLIAGSAVLSVGDA